MKSYHYYFYIIRLIIFIAILLMSIGLIPIDGKYYIIVQDLFKISLGIFIIIYFSNKNLNIDSNDKNLFFIIGIILISMVNYNELYEIIIKSIK
jgi:hypothetical protein